MVEKLKDYVDKQLDSGYSKGAIKKALADAGYSKKEIDSALSAPKPRKAKAPARKGPKMGMLEKWFKSLITPGEVFRAEYDNASIGEGAKHIALAGIIAGIISGLSIFFVPMPELEELFMLFRGMESTIRALIAIIVIAVTPLAMFLSWFIIGGIYYIFAKIFGGKGTYTRQIYFMSIYIAPLAIIEALLGWLFIEVVAEVTLGNVLIFIVGLYALYPLTLALKESHQFSLGKAVLSWLCFYIIIIAIYVTVFGSIMSAFGVI